MADSHRMSLAQSHAHHGHSQSGLLDKFVGIAMSKAPLQKKRRAGIMKTKLSAREVEMAEEVWHMYVLSGFVRSFGELQQLLSALQIPQQPLITNLAKERFEEKSHFSFMDFTSLLEQCKTIHVRWLYKIREKSLDDDLLEAFVAVGGEDDAGGEVDLAQMKSVIREFNLKVDIDRIVQEMDTDGNANIDFGEFADLLRENAKSATADDVLALSEDGAIGSSQTTKPVVLSQREFFADDAELGYDGFARRKTGVDLADDQFMGRRRSSDHHNEHSGMKRTMSKSMKPGAGGLSGSMRPGQMPALGASTLASPARAKTTEPVMTASTTPGASSYYKGSGGLRSLPPGGRSASPSLPPIGKKGTKKKHKFANW